ncbi:RC-LH1 core complex protein PufX [Actibacterium sp. 188UL27-1]|uniref:RC-LH1 core complex protein PufX n=1 Tax=Actibacterium sp. 188UL27-1 TaxID=2786961 RepID=UPI00195D65B8|nr:RC-LH1 core complex protein PufX [Actibacterium sp. 188UL27-1]MBM7070032.1 RC-LH1 core complex protein PufX [Actibacterium sp. 188UL27-1]
MSEEKPIFGAEYEPTDRERLAYQGMFLMLQGAGYAAAVFAAVLFLIYGMIAFSWLLPPESKEAPDPTPLSFLIESEVPANRHV